MKIAEIHGYVIKVRGESYLGGHTTSASSERRGDYVRHKSYRSAYSLNTETFLVKIVAEDGSFGWGEAQAPLVPEVPAELVRRLVGPFLIGADISHIAQHWRDAYDGMRERGHINGYQLDAIAACDIALWDLKGKLLGVPVSSLAGGRHRDRVPCYVSGLPATDDAGRAAKAMYWHDKGFRHFKVALGESINADVATFTRLRDVLGEDSAIYVDAHWRYSVSEAITLGRELDALNLGFLEAPVAPEDGDGQAVVAAAIRAPVAIGEELRTRYDFRDRLIRRSAGLIQPDVGRMGITEALAVASLAEAFNVPVALHLGVGLGIYIAAGIHTGAAIPNLLTMEYQPTQFELAQSLLTTELTVDPDGYSIPEGPGLGVEVDLEALAPHIADTFTLTVADL